MFVMATGTGKTYTAFQIAWRLIHAKNHPVRNVLYLVDRTALADQPQHGDFKYFHDSKITLKRDKLEHWDRYKNTVDIYFGLYQSLFAGNKKKGKKFLYENIDRDFFDLIIVDEAHRASARESSNWRQILNYFSPVDKGQTKSKTIVIGMTATPNTKKDANPEYFGHSIYNYSLKQGIDDGFLAPYKIIHIETNLDKYGFLPKKHERDANGREIPFKRYYDFYRSINIQSQTQATARIISNYLKRHHQRNAKTIIFCVNQAHARDMATALENENNDLVSKYDKAGQDYIAQITSDADNAQDKLKRFEDIHTKTPTLVTTSDMLRTGVNAPDVKLIVLATHVNSPIEFKQMIGRGTRLSPKHNKHYFTIMDFGNNIHHFNDKNKQEKEFEGRPDEETDIDTEDFKNLIDRSKNDKYQRPHKKFKKPTHHHDQKTLYVKRNVVVLVEGEADLYFK